MIFYRVREAFDNVYKNPKVHNSDIYVWGELLTENEVRKLPYIYPNSFDRINIPKRRTYFFFGARFAMEGGDAI